VLDELSDAEVLDWSRACINAVSVRAKKGGELTKRNPPTGANTAPSITCCATPTGYHCTL
jgi:hypothetical protein